MPRLHFAIEEAGRARQTQRRLRDVVARLRFNSLAELFPVGCSAVRTDQHAVAAGLADGLHHQLVEMLEHIASLRTIAQQIGLHIREDRIFAQVVADDRRHIGVDRLVVGDAGADRIGQDYIACAISVEQSGNAQA